VDKMVFATPVGQLTQILESNLGYSFIKVVSRRGETVSPLTEVKAKIAMFILDENEDAVVKALLKKIAKGSKIEFKNPPPGETSAAKGEPAEGQPAEQPEQPEQ
jgi:parvulin-like peptidyl-prolyl isomerase